MFARQILVLIVSLSVALAHPLAFHKQARDAVPGIQTREIPSEFQALFDGNQQFRTSIASSQQPNLLKTLTDEGQAPPFMFLGCSDSRVSEGTVFSAKPGTLFSQRNIANQFHHTDANTHSVYSYAIAELKVKHVIIMGHYGCGGVAAAIATPPKAPIDAANGAVQNWIAPIREIFATSTRPEIVELRERIKGQEEVEEPEPQEPGFRALVEENVKAGVRAMVADSVLSNHYAALAGNGTEHITGRSVEGPLADVFVHGLVYDIENGEIRDLGISVGPPGKPIPELPFPKVNSTASAEPINNAVGHVATASTSTEHSAREACIQGCKAKRGLFNSY
ncbi:Carbonic anhydrase [Pleurotus pulmonarius]